MNTAEFVNFKKGETVLEKGNSFKNCVVVLMNTQLNGTTVRYVSNSVVEIAELIDNREFVIKEDMVAADEGSLCKISISL